MTSQYYKTTILIQGPMSHDEHAEDFQQLLAERHTSPGSVRVSSHPEQEGFLTMVEFEHRQEDSGELADMIFYFLLGTFGYQAQVRVSSLTVEQ